MTTISDHSPSGLRVRWEESVWPGETVREDGAAILEDQTSPVWVMECRLQWRPEDDGEWEDMDAYRDGLLEGEDWQDADPYDRAR